MILCHSQNSNIRIHIWGSTHNEFIVLEADPIRYVFSECHFGIQINATIVPKCHPSPDVSFECFWSQHFESFISSFNSNFFHFLWYHLDISIKCLVVEIFVFSAVRQVFLWVSLEPLWLPRAWSKDEVVDSFSWHFVLLFHLLNERVRDSTPVDSTHVSWLISFRVFEEHLEKLSSIHVPRNLLIWHVKFFVFLSVELQWLLWELRIKLDQVAV